MADFVFRLNTRIVAPDVMVPTQLESLDLDIPTGSYDFFSCVYLLLGRFGPRGGYFEILFGAINGGIIL